ncbi:hypothetical protein HHI36_013661 [Cryptolaemus montrouzieri]|uniref:Uncharacterized protein n=1 Tax=Cryptolaemus montrouzieri TaxID=559131 RepID=A0ABD2NIV5_9CUCU
MKLPIMFKNEFLKLYSCRTSLLILDQIIPTLYRKEQSLKDLMSIQHRVKRAWLNIIGSAFKTVFGTLDEDDAKQYNEAITKVKKNENRMLDLMKQQIHVVKSTILNFNYTINNLNKNRDLFNSNLQK